MGLSSFIAAKRKIGKGQSKDDQIAIKRNKFDSKEDDHWWFLNN